MAQRRMLPVIAAVAVLAAALAVGAAVRKPPARSATVRSGQPQVRVPRLTTPSVSKGPSFAPGSATSREAQSRAWFAGGTWWAVLGGPSAGLRVYELTADHGWRDTGTIVDDRPRASADVLWDGTHAVAVTRTTGGAISVSRLSYVGATRAFVVDPRFPVKLAGGGALAATIARDSSGMLWSTFVQGRRVWIAHSLAGDDTRWAPASPLPPATSAVKDEDLAVVSAFGGRVGVLWSDQVSGSFHFATHIDRAPPNQWSVEALPLDRPLSADNHISMKVSGDGTLYAVVKTSFGDRPGRSAAAQVVLLVRSLAGEWSVHPVASVADAATRGIVLLDDADHLAYVLLTAPEPGGAVYMKAASYDRLAFDSGRGQRILSAPSAVISDATTTKQTVDKTTGIVVVGADQKAHSYYRADIPLGPGR